MGKAAIKQFLPMKNGDVYSTFADVIGLEQEVGYKPKTPLKDGTKNFIGWNKFYHVEC